MSGAIDRSEVDRHKHICLCIHIHEECVYEAFEIHKEYDFEDEEFKSIPFWIESNVFIVVYFRNDLF